MKELGHRVKQYTGEVNESKGIPLTVSLRSYSERECDFNVGICERPVRAGPVLCVEMPITLLFIHSFIYIKLL